MKREITCKECADCWRNTFGAVKYPGEYLRIIKGKALGYYLCDGCNKRIENYEEAYAVSVWSDTSPYNGPWEQHFISDQSILV